MYALPGNAAAAKGKKGEEAMSEIWGFPTMSDLYALIVTEMQETIMILKDGRMQIKFPSGGRMFSKASSADEAIRTVGKLVQTDLQQAMSVHLVPVGYNDEQIIAWLDSHGLKTKVTLSPIQ